MLLFKGTLPTTVTEYVNVPIGPNGRLFLDVQWKDATSSATITIETTGSPAQPEGTLVDGVPYTTAGQAWQWKNESGITITGPAASAAGSTKVHVSNLFTKRARLKIVTAAACIFEIHSETN